MARIRLFPITIILCVCSGHALQSVEDNYFNQYISHQSTYTAETSASTLPFTQEAVDVLYDQNGKCFVLMTADNVLWSSRQVTRRHKLNLEPIYGDWKKVYDFSDIGSHWKMVKAPDSIVLVSSPHMYEAVMDFSCSTLISLEPRLDPAAPSWGATHALQIGFDSLWIGSDEGLLQVSMTSTNVSEYWSLAGVDSIPSDTPVTSLAAVEPWGILFAGTATVFYELRFSPGSRSEYYIHYDWIGGNIDGPVLAMAFDVEADCLWVVEADSIHCRDSAKMWWRFGYYQGAITGNLTSVAVVKSSLNGKESSGVWAGTSEHGLMRLRVDEALLSGVENTGPDSWTRWLLFYGPRYLPDGHVKLLVSDSVNAEDREIEGHTLPEKYDTEEEGSTGSETLLVVTEKGVSWITTERWTLWEKQEAMQSFQYPRHDRNGIVAEVSLESYGDLSSYHHTPEDSDSIWTAQYTVAAAFRYASTGLESDRLQAWRSYEALEMLGNVTGVEGLVGRTMCSPRERETSASLTNNDSGSTNNLRVGTRERTARSSVMGSAAKTIGCGVDGENNWHMSQSMPGWVWKGDTSSDTVDGHYFAYGVVLDLVAHGNEERGRVVHAIDRLTSYIVQNDLYYIDVTGEPTKWGRWNPADLNEDPNFISERGGNSLEILSFLALAYSVTGKQIYEDTFHELTEKHNYFENVKNQKIDNPFDDNHSDNELGFMAYHTLFYANKRLHMSDCHLSTEERLERMKRLEAMTAPVLPSMRRFWRIVRNEKSPLWISGMAGAAGLQVSTEDVTYAVESLQLWALDMIAWGVRNTGRWDCVQQPYYGRDNPEEVQMKEVLPPQERITSHWNTNPFKFDTSSASSTAYDGGGGMTEYSPAEWLLPYWMMKFYGLIADPK